MGINCLLACTAINNKNRELQEFGAIFGLFTLKVTYPIILTLHH